MNEYKYTTITIVKDETCRLNDMLNEHARQVGNLVRKSIANPKIECVITYPKGINELIWDELGSYYHSQNNGDKISFRAYLLHNNNGGFHEEVASGFGDEPLVIILFSEPVWDDSQLMKEMKPNYLLFSNDDKNGGCYACGVAYYFTKKELLGHD